MAGILNINTATPANPDRSVLMIYTGGTLGMRKASSSGSLEPFDFEHLISQAPELRNLKIELGIISYEEPLDSSNIGPTEWIEMARILKDNYQNYDGFVILHGTDTMAYSASALSFLLEGLSKPVVFTGAQVPIGSPRTDARNNMITALEIASDYKNGEARLQEVAIYFDYVLFRGNRASKIESNYFDAFSSENYPALAQVGISIDYQDAFLFRPKIESLSIHEEMRSDVEVVKIFPGMKWRSFSDQAQMPSGLVIETFGSGNIPDDPEMVNDLKNLIENGIPALNLSQCPGGIVAQGKYAASLPLQKIGVIDGGDMTFEAGLTKMMYCLSRYKEKNQLIEALSSSIRGEKTLNI